MFGWRRVLTASLRPCETQPPWERPLTQLPVGREGNSRLGSTVQALCPGWPTEPTQQPCALGPFAGDEAHPWLQGFFLYCRRLKLGGSGRVGGDVCLQNHGREVNHQGQIKIQHLTPSLPTCLQGAWSRFLSTSTCQHPGLPDPRHRENRALLPGLACSHLLPQIDLFPGQLVVRLSIPFRRNSSLRPRDYSIVL